MAVSSPVGHSHRVLKYVAGAAGVYLESLADQAAYLMRMRMVDGAPAWSVSPLAGTPPMVGKTGWTDGASEAVSWDSREIFYGGSRIYHYDTGDRVDNLGLFHDAFTVDVAFAFVEAKTVYAAFAVTFDSGRYLKAVSMTLTKVGGGYEVSAHNVLASETIADHDPGGKNIVLWFVSQSQTGRKGLILGYSGGNWLVSFNPDLGEASVSLEGPNGADPGGAWHCLATRSASDDGWSYTLEITLNREEAFDIGALWTVSEDGGGVSEAYDLVTFEVDSYILQDYDAPYGGTDTFQWMQTMTGTLSCAGISIPINANHDVYWNSTMPDGEGHAPWNFSRDEIITVSPREQGRSSLFVIQHRVKDLADTVISVYDKNDEVASIDGRMSAASSPEEPNSPGNPGVELTNGLLKGEINNWIEEEGISATSRESTNFFDFSSMYYNSVISGADLIRSAFSASYFSIAAVKDRSVISLYTNEGDVFNYAQGGNFSALFPPEVDAANVRFHPVSAHRR